MSDSEKRTIPRRVVLKFGTRLLTRGQKTLQRDAVAEMVAAVARHRDTQTVIVSSGAVAAGYPALGLDKPPKGVAVRQAAAAVGQARLMQMYADLFGKYDIAVGQILLTNDAFTDRKRYLNATHAFRELFAAGVVPIVNENDTVSVDEIKVGDNDNLAAHTATLVEADLLVLLTDMDGVYDADPKREPGAKIIRYAASSEELRKYTWGKRAEESTGGMTTKLQAADKASAFGIPTLIASGLDAANIEAVYAGQEIGTWIHASPTPLRPRQHWIAIQSLPHGKLVVDAGAAEALRRTRKSLLAKGVTEVKGSFEAGDVVAVVDDAGGEIARGVVGYNSQEVAVIKGRHSRDFAEILGYIVTEEVIHADDMVVLERR